jgi:hypothetical protein
MHYKEATMKCTNILAFLAIATLSGCATPYQRQTAMGGYSETQLSENVFTVIFKGNGYTSRERASDFALLRSAEVALENGYKYFIIIDAQNYTKNIAYTTPTTSHTTGYANTHGTLNTYGNYGTYSGSTYGSATTTTYGGQTYLISKPRTSNMILCLKEKPEGNQFVFDASFLKKSLRQKYELDNNLPIK